MSIGRVPMFAIGAALVGCAFLLGECAHAVTILVRHDGTGDQPSISAAMVVAADGDTILLAPGTYIGAANRDVDFGGRAVVVTSQDGPGTTIIDCEQSGRAFYIHTSETSGSVVSGLTIENGLIAIGNGGAILCTGASPTLEDNVIRSCQATQGGAIACLSDADPVIRRIPLGKDVDGLHPGNVGDLARGTPRFAPCTPAGVLELLARYGLSVRGKHVVIIGRSNLVGRPLASLLLLKGDRGDATATVCHSRSERLAEIVRSGDIVVAAVGRPNVVTADMVRPGAIVVDVGINRIDDPDAPKGSRLVGDVDYEAVKEVASWITPVPGGVGPMTIAMLLSNTVQAAEAREIAGDVVPTR